MTDSITLVYRPEIIRYIGFFISIMIFIFGFIIYVKNNRAIELEKNMNKLTKEELEKAKEKNNKKFKIFTCIAVIIFVVQYMFCIVTSMALKPIIYLYPEKEQEISVVLGNPAKLECTYPKYENSWEVFAKPNGDLIDLKTGRKLYALYWEGKNDKTTSKITEGFCIKGEDTARFLEEKLAILGLTEREAEEFIVYWLPKLEKNKYNLIRFETIEEIEDNMPLYISPKPDSIIRVMMDFKGSSKYINLPEQELITPVRNKFVVVEWGGTEIK